MGSLHPGSRITYTYLHTPESAIDRHEYFTWKMRETGLRYSLTARTRPDAPFDAQVPLHRSRKAGHPSQHEITTFAHIFPHIERALRLAWQLNTAPLASAAADHVLDGIAHGVVLLDRRGHVVFANRAARDMAARADGFALSGDGIRGLHPFNDGMLQRLIASAIQPDGTNPFKRGGAMRLPRRFDKRDYAVLVAPLAPRTGLFAGLAPAACVTIADPAEPVAPLGTLRDLYGLTPAELRLAEHLARGNTPREAAAASGLAVSTVREQLAALLRKTGTARQADLVGLIRTIASASPPGP